MSGNQEPRISLPTWRCSDFNAAIPIKKRKYFVQPQLPAIDEAGSASLEKIPQPNEQGDISVGRSVLDSYDADENTKMTGGGSRKSIGEPIASFPSVSMGNADKAESIGNIVLDQIRVKVEEPNFPINSSHLTGLEIPSSSSNIIGSSLHCSLGKLPMGAEHPGVVVRTHDIVRETCGTENLSGECQTEASSGSGIVSMRLSCKTKNSWENEEHTTLNLSLGKGVCALHNTDSIFICTKSGNHSGVNRSSWDLNRSNWDLNTTMDAWEDDVDSTTRVKTTGPFLNNDNRSFSDIETSSCRDRTVIAKSVFEKQKENVRINSPTVTLMKFHHQVNPTCSLSLGPSSYPLIEKSSLLATTLEAKAVCTSFSRPIMMAGNANSVNLKTVKSEVIEETVREKTQVKQEVVGRFGQESSLSSGILKPVDPISIKAELNNFTHSEGFNRKNRMLIHPHTPVMQSNEIFDLRTNSTPNQKDIYIPYSNGISDATMSLNGMAINPGIQSYPDYTLKEDSGQSSSAAKGKFCEVLKHGGVRMTYSCSGHGDHNLNALGVNVTSLTEEKILDDCKTCISKELPRNSRGTDELFIRDKEKMILSGKEPEEELDSHEFESDCGHDLSRVIKKQVGERILYDDRKVKGPAAVFGEGNDVAHAKCGGSETEQRDNSVQFHGEFQISNHVEKGSQPAVGNTGESEGRIVQDGEEPTHQIIHASEGMSGVSTLSGGNVENSVRVDNSSPVSYKAEVSTIDNDPPAEFSEDSFVPLRMERDRLPDFPLEPRKYLLRGSDESWKVSRERYHGKRRLNFMPDRRGLSDKTESNLHDRDTKSFEFDNHGNTRRCDAFMSNFHRGRRPANNEVTPFSHSFPRRTPSFSFHRGPTNKEDSSAFHGFRDGENLTRGLQYNNKEPMFMSPPRPYQGRNGFARGQTKFLNNPKRGYPGFRSRSPIRSRERSAGTSSSFRNRSQEEFSAHTDFSHQRSPSSYRMGRVSSPDHSCYPREMVVRRHNSPPYSQRPSNAGRGRGYARGRGYGRDGISFRKPSDHLVHRNYGNLNNLDPRERVDYSVDVNVERRQFGYRNDGASSFRPSFNNDGCAPTNVDNDVRFGQDSDIEIEEQGRLMEIDGKDENTAENAFGRGGGNFKAQ